jgi:hypothetical protein
MARNRVAPTPPRTPGRVLPEHELRGTDHLAPTSYHADDDIHDRQNTPSVPSARTTSKAGSVVRQWSSTLVIVWWRAVRRSSARPADAISGADVLEATLRRCAQG